MRWNAATPKFFAVDKPYVNGYGPITIQGDAFGATPGTVTLDGAAVPVTSWANGQIVMNVPFGFPAGPHQLSIKASNGQSTVNGLTLHVFSGSFPSTAVLDDFNRGTGNPPLGANWAGPLSQNTGAYRIQTFPSPGNRQVQVRVTGVTGSIYWNAPGASNFGLDQEAYFTFTDVSANATEQDLLLKVTGLAGGATIDQSATGTTAMIEAWYDRAAGLVRIETLEPGGVWKSHTPIPAAFANGDQFGVRALADGTVNVYKNGVLLGSTNVVTTGWPAVLAAGGGQIGVWFLGTGSNTGTSLASPQDAHFDDFGGGNMSTLSYNPSLFEVGIGKTYDPTSAASNTGGYEHALQDALNAAAGEANALVVVYPGPTSLYNPHGIYFENIVISSPVKLQGVGPGGQRADNSYVNGAVLDGVGFTNDNPASEDWRVLVGSIGQVGNPNVAEGEVIYVIARAEDQFTSGYRAAIDGLTIQGGDQTGFPNNINFVGGGQTSIATATSTLTLDAVTSVTVTSGGSGYTTPPPVTFVGGGGSGATATATLTGVVASVTVTNGGTGYTTPPTVTFVGDGSGATATATLTEEGAVNDIIVTNGGSGYTTPPLVTFVGDGSGATADAALDTVVASVTVTSGGSGYTTPPTVIIAPPPAPGPAGQGFIETQGGGLFVNGYARFLQITNNVIKSNGGAYAGAIRLGTPDIGDNENDNIRIANNRIIANGGTNLAGAIGLFTGSDDYEIANNDLCGNFSAEYGGAISHYGRSPNGAIHDNRIYFNQSYDEGGGVMIVGELPVFPATVSTGTGPVSVYNNLIQSNLGNDDGGGVRVLMSNDDLITIYNNFIVNNISTDEGGGIALDTAANVRVYNNTLMNNITTATAATSDGTAKPAGFTTDADSPDLVLFNNIFWDNRAGEWDGVTVAGIGLAASPAINLWDLGVVGSPALLSPTNSILNVTTGTNVTGSGCPPPSGSATGANCVGVDPLVQAEYDTSVAVFPWRTNPNFVQAAIVAIDLPINLLGNYHLTAGSPARDKGAASKTVGALTVNAPATDIDGNPRPSLPGFEIGADEYPVTVYLALSGATLPVSTGGTLAFANEDILAFNGVNYDMVFDGSDIPRVGFPAQQVLAGTRIDDFAVLSPTRILMSFTDPILAGRLPGVPLSFGAIDDSDIVQFDATSLGLTTAGTFSIYFDGSDPTVGLTTAGEDVNSLEVLPNGDLVISTVNNASVPGIPGAVTGRHLLRCAGTFGESTTCTWSMYFDGTDVGLNETSDEVIDGQAIAANGDIYLSTMSGFNTSPVVPTLTGADEDIFVCRPILLGATTACTYLPLFFDGSAFGLGLAGNDVTGIELP